MYKLLLFFGILLIVSSCSSSKFDYQSAYRFKYQPSFAPINIGASEGKHTGDPQETALPKVRQEQVSQQQNELGSDQLVASLKPVAPVSTTTPTDQVKPASEMTGSITPISKESFDALSKAEKRAVRHQVKQDFKTLKQEYRKAENDAANQDIVFNKKMFIGLVIFAAGLLVAILASGPVGAIGIIVGIGLIAWGIIEQA